MFVDDAAPDELQHLCETCRTLTSTFLADVPLKTENVRFPAQTTLDLSARKSVFLLKEGILKECYRDNTLITHEEGDLIGADALLLSKPTSLSTEFAVVADEYDGLELLDYLRSDDSRYQAWNHYLMTLIQIYQVLVGHYKKGEVKFHPEMRQYATNEVIIEEGSEGNEVFTLLTGSADVIVADTPVGQVKQDEIFGAIAALTGTRRTAKVTASSPCTVLVVPSDRFRDLLAARPDTVAKLVADMARTIVSSNEMIVSLTTKM